MPIDVKVQHRFFSSGDVTTGTDFHPTQPWLLTGHANGNITIYNVDSGRVVHSFFLYGYCIWCVKFIARKNWYVVGSTDGQLHIFNDATHKEIFVFRAHSFTVYCLAVHPTDPIVLTGSLNEIKAWNWDKRWDSIRVYNANNSIRSIAFNPKGPNIFASASNDGIIKIWSIGSPIPHSTINALLTINFIDFHPGADKPYLITASDDKTIKVWNYLTQTCVQTMTGHTNRVMFAVFHPRLPIIISGSRDNTVNIWNSASYAIKKVIRYKRGVARCVAIRKDTGDVAVGFDSSVVTLQLSHRGPSEVAVSRSGHASKEQVDEILENRVMEEPAMVIPTTDPDHEPELTESLDDLTTTYTTAFSPSPSPATPSQLDSYQQCFTLVMGLMADKIMNNLISELREDKAQYMTDFLSKIVSDEETFTRRDRKRTLYLLSKLAKSAQVFPQSLELEGVQCNLTNPVAAGGYGFIYKGEHEGRKICIKAVRVDSRGVDKKKMRAHAGELIFWGHLCHPNILPFLGIYPSSEPLSRVCIVSPWMENGDLLEYLNTVSDAPRKPLVRDIISGLQYLHDLDIIHADLKAKNVLVSGAGTAMLADFGISRLSLTHTTMFTNAGTGSANWMAPELHIDDEPSPSREADIWAFACTCYEIITSMMPFGQYRNPAMLIGAFMRGKIVPVKPEKPGIEWDEDVWSIAARCWQRDPENRPRAQELLDMIDSFNYPDDRSLDLNLQRRRIDAKVDYDRIFRILDEIRQSATV